MTARSTPAKRFVRKASHGEKTKYKVLEKERLHAKPASNEIRRGKDLTSHPKTGKKIERKP